MNESKRLIKNTGIIAIGNLSTRLVSFLLLPLYTSLLSTSEYGIVDYIISLSVFIVPFSTFLMDEALFRFLIDCKDEQDRKDVFSSSMIIALLGEALFLLVTIPIVIFIRYEYGLILILYVTFSSLSMMLNAFLRGIGRTDQYALFNFLQGSLTILLNILFVIGLHKKANGILYSSILAMGSICFFFLCKFKVWKYVDIKAVNKETAKNIIKYSAPLIPNKVSWSIVNVSDRLIIMNMIGSSASGLYAISYKFPNLMDTVYGFFFQSWKESSARVMGQQEQNVFYQQVYSSLRRCLFSIILLFTAFMPLAFKILINSNFHDAILYVPILMIGTYYSNMSGFYGGIFTAYKETKIMAVTTMIAAASNLIVHLLLIRYIGLYAASVSTLVSCYVVYIYRRIKVKEHIKLDEEILTKIVSYIILAGVLVCFYLGGNTLTIVSMIISVGYAVFVNKKLIAAIINNLKNRTAA